MSLGLEPALVRVLFWSAVGCCAVAQLFIVAGAMRTPRAGGEAGVPRPRRWSEVVWTIVPAVGLAVVLMFTWRAVEAKAAPEAVASPHAGHAPAAEGGR